MSSVRDMVAPREAVDQVIKKALTHAEELGRDLTELMSVPGTAARYYPKKKREAKIGIYSAD